MEAVGIIILVAILLTGGSTHIDADDNSVVVIYEERVEVLNDEAPEDEEKQTGKLRRIGKLIKKIRD